MNKSLISIIVPVYNVEKHIKRCIDSLLCQTYENIEIIIINDGSTDQTAQILSEYSNETKIRIFHQENKGVSFGRNLGLEQAKGDYICFVDGDDYVSAHYCQRLYEKLIENDADISICQFTKIVNGKHKPQKIDFESRIYSKMEALSLIFEDGELQSFPWGKLFKKETIKNATFPTDKKAFEDYVTIFRIIEKCEKVVIFDDLLYYYIVNEGSLSNNTSCRMYYDFFTALIEMYDFAKTMNDELTNWKKIVEKTARQCHTCIKKISIHKKTKEDFLILEQVSKDTEKFYQLEKKRIPFSIKWKIWTFLKVPMLYNLYISFKKISK